MAFNAVFNSGKNESGCIIYIPFKNSLKINVIILIKYIPEVS